jgi:hypothetical protein
MKNLLLSLLIGGVASINAIGQTDPAHWQFAKAPPLGWNSWDIFGTTVTEEQVKQQAEAMATHLLPAGYDVLTVDIQWYEPNSRGHVYKPGAELSMDRFGRLTPAENRFPSATRDRGFKQLADFVHSKGLRFGIHIMRGIPRQAVTQNTPVLGTDAHAQDIAVTKSTCPWNPDMYGVDATKAAGQAYYDSLFKMYADWGVDYVKVDDISRPYSELQKTEIEAIRRAIDKTGRPIVLSLSPGAAPLRAGEHVFRHANLWRITDDFWDRWGMLHAMFERVDAWTPYRRPGAWPDADMLPLGVLEFGRKTRFTVDEQYTLMTLWAIAKSPLIFGGDMTKLDDLTLKLLTNPRMLQVNQQSTNNRQVSRVNDLIVWTADEPATGAKYVALFNAQSQGDSLGFANAVFASPVITGRGSSQKIEVAIGGAKRLVLFVKDGGDGFDHDHAAWVEPLLRGPAGELSLTAVDWAHAESGWGETLVDRTCAGQPLRIGGATVNGIGIHAESKIVFELPSGYDTFTTTGVVTDSGSVVFGVLVDRAVTRLPQRSEVSVKFDEIGLAGKARVTDLWRNEDLGVFQGRFRRTLPMHGAGLYKLTPVTER